MGIRTTAPEDGERRVDRAGRREQLIDAATVFAVALVARVAVYVVYAPAMRGTAGYDQSVYFAASDALIHGRMPYRDFLLLHPPGLMLVLTPFAGLAQLTSDRTGFDVANLAFLLLGAANAVLLVRVARIFGRSRRAALAGGLFYAVWFGVVAAETSARLEPLGNFAVLCGLLALYGSRSGQRRWVVLAGAAFGFAACVKIWWVVPLVVVVAAHLRTADARRRAALVLAGAGASALLVVGPFAVAAPSAFWRMVVYDQLARPSSANRAAVHRIALMTTLNPGARTLGGAALAVAAGLCAALAVALLVTGLRSSPGRMPIVLAVIQTVVLFVGPTYYSYYGAFLAPALALTVAAAAEPQARRWAPRAGPAVAVLVVAVCTAATVSAVVQRARYPNSTFSSRQLARGLTHVRCLMSDSPTALIQLDQLSRGLANGCPNWVDVTGRILDYDAVRNGHLVSKRENRRWQRDVLHYLLSGDAVIIVQPRAELDRATKRTIRRHPVLARSGRYVVYAVTR